ncbi:hypothetical protein ABMA10_00675 [Plantibacter sp. RU18]
MRRINSAATLTTLYGTDEALTMAELHTATGLSRRTLDLILGPLIDVGWVEDRSPSSSVTRAAGRPAKSYRLNVEGACVVAIQLDINRLSVVVSDLRGTARGSSDAAAPESISRADRMGILSRTVGEALDESGHSFGSVLAVTVSTPGVVHDDGTVDLPLSMAEWSGFSLSAELHDMFPCEVVVENDAKLAAIGEKWAGTGAAVENFIWMRFDGIRIGMGVVIGGELYRGHDGAAGEIVWADAFGFRRIHGHVMSGLVDADHPRHADAVETAALARAADAHALGVVDELADIMKPGLVALSWALAPDEIIIGGALSQISDLLIPALERSLGTERQPIATRIIGSRLGEGAMLAGGLRRCLDTVQARLQTPADLPNLRIVDAFAEPRRV